MKAFSPFASLILAVLLVCCCMTWLVVVGMGALMMLNVSSEASLVPATIAPVVTSTPRAPRANPYSIVIATPTSAPIERAIMYVTDLKIVTFPVAGKSATEISQSLDANALIDAHEPNARYYARTDWYLAGNWQYAPTVRGCQVTGGYVAMTVTMTLPSLVTANVPGDVQKRWDDFLDNVIVHESGHVKIGYDGAREYQHQLGNFPAMANCDVLKSQLQDLFQQNYRRIDQLNVEYDRTTRHGETQGAVFP